MAEGDGLEAAAGAAAEAAGVAAGITGGGGGGCECIITTGEWYGGKGKASFFLIKSSQSSCFNCSSTISLESTSFTRLETWEINSEIDSSVAKEGGEGSFDGLASFASCNGTSDLARVEAAAFEDPSTATSFN